MSECDSIAKLRLDDAHTKTKLRLCASVTLLRFLLELRIQIRKHGLNMRQEHGIGAVQGENCIPDPHRFGRRIAVQITAQLLCERQDYFLANRKRRPRKHVFGAKL